MEEEVPADIKKQRIAILDTINKAQKNAYRLQSINTKQNILIEKIEQQEELAIATGFSEYYIPVEITTPHHNIQMLADLGGHAQTKNQSCQKISLHYDFIFFYSMCFYCCGIYGIEVF
jgi:tRNA A37 methylthiotransferase MiaB